MGAVGTCENIVLIFENIVVDISIVHGVLKSSLTRGTTELGLHILSICPW